MTAFGARAAGKILATLFLFASGGLLAPAAAQTPPPYDNRDENGVDRVTGRFAQTMVEGGIGGDSGVSMVRYYGESAGDSWTGILLRSASGATQYATISFGKISERFTKSGANWVADKGNGATLTENVADMQFTYRAPDGTSIFYAAPRSMITPTFGAVITESMCGGAGAAICGLPVGMSRPDGQSFALTWKAVEGCVYPQGPGGPILPGDGPGEEPIQCTVYTRLSDVRTNSSFGMKVKYQSNMGRWA